MQPKSTSSSSDHKVMLFPKSNKRCHGSEEFNNNSMFHMQEKQKKAIFGTVLNQSTTN